MENEIDFFWIYGQEADGITCVQKNKFGENEVLLSCLDDYDHLPLKTRKMCEFFLAQYQFDYLFKCDDDTFIDMGKFKRFCDAEIAQHDYLGNECTPGANYASGGAGYFLSRTCCKIISNSSLNQGAEDLQVGQLLAEHSINLTTDKRFIPYGNEQLRPLPSNDIITTHACGIPFDKFNVTSNQNKVSFIPQGRHGNLLFQWAAAMAYSLEFGHKLVLMSNLESYAPFFSQFPVEDIRNAQPGPWTVGDPSDFSHNELLHHDGNVLLAGFKYSDKYFNKHIAIIRKYIGQGIATPELDFECSVAVHVRRGDFLRQQEYHPVCGQQYYYLAFESLFELKSINSIVISSDDIEWCKENFHYDILEHKNLVFLQGLPMEDLLALSKCEHHIICCSSFSLWSVYLNENPHKIVMCPDEFLGTAFFEQGYVEKDIIDPSWHRIKNVDYQIEKCDTLHNGSWTNIDNSGHIFDPLLCGKIIEVLNRNLVTSALDVGCGDGSYTRQIINAGINCIAYDGNENTVEMTEGLGQTMDFSMPVSIAEYFDCVMSLEVGEHIPPLFEKTFISNLCKLSKSLVILSWATPGQGGWGHYNERGNAHIKEAFLLRGFKSDDDLEAELRQHVSDSYSWFRNSIMVFRKKLD